MPIEVRCNAGHTLKVADTWAGRTGRCPVCKALVQVPVPARTPAVEGPRSKVQGLGGEVSGSRFEVSSSTFEVQGPSTKDQGRGSEVGGSTHQVAAPKPPALPPPLPVIKTGLGGEVLNATGVGVQAPLIRAAVDDVVAEVADARLIVEAQMPSAPEPATTTVVVEQPIAREGAAERSATVTRLPVARPDPLLAGRPDLQHAVRPSSPQAAREEETGATRVQAANQSSNGATQSTVETVQIPTPATPGYAPDSDKRWTVYYVGAAMLALSLYCMAPALRYWNLSTAPDWARAVLLLSLLQLAYMTWVVSIPDWATLWSSMIVYTILAALYGATMTVALTTPSEQNVLLELTDVRRQAPLWCASVVLLSFLLAYFCGHAAWRWRRTFELMHA